MKPKKIAIVYDRINKWGGAERILLALHSIFPKAPLFTAVYSAKKAKWAYPFSIYRSFLQEFPWARDHHQLYPVLMPLAFESFSFDEYDLVISVTSEAAKGIITKPTTKHLCICLTPIRYLWSGYNEYFNNSFLRFAMWPIIAYLKKWDKIASQRPDKYIAISENVKRRIAKYYQRESQVMYPYSELAQRLLPLTPKKGEYFLVVSRLSRFTNYKHVELAIKAASRLKVSLVVICNGSNRFLRKYAGSTITFVYHPSDDKLLEYYLGAKALIFPGIEDFGLTMVEAQAAGKPVIAYKDGGALEIVKKGTGIFFESQTTESLIQILQSFSQHDYNSKSCKENAKRFSQRQFEDTLQKIIESL